MSLIEWEPGQEDLARFTTVEEALEHFNTLLLVAAREADVSVAPIAIKGVAGDAYDADKIAAIWAQFQGLMQRLTISPSELEE